MFLQGQVVIPEWVDDLDSFCEWRLADDSPTNHKINQPPFECDKKAFFGDYIGIDAFGGRVVAAFQHFADKKLVLSAAIFDFQPGRQELRGK